jgi:hypothetical protein
MGIRPHHLSCILFIFLFALAGCNLIPSTIPSVAPMATITTSPTIPPKITPSAKFTLIPSVMPKPALQPGEPPKPLRLLQDNNSSPYAKMKSISSGDNPLNDLYERPFTSGEMIYQPEIDILSAEVAQDENFYYFTITLQGLDANSKSLDGTYGVEFDRTLTGHGDILVTASQPAKDWSTDNVNIFLDKNKDVGGPNPIVADRGFKGDGYETHMPMEGNLMAYARLELDKYTALQFAISRQLIGAGSKFLWGVWASKDNLNPGWFDLDDHFGKSEAGSPMRTSSDYPLKAVNSLDNTCRLNFGFFPLGIIPGMCISGPQASHSGEACTCTRPDPLSGVCYQWYCK